MYSVIVGYIALFNFQITFDNLTLSFFLFCYHLTALAALVTTEL